MNILKNYDYEYIYKRAGWKKALTLDEWTHAKDMYMECREKIDKVLRQDTNIDSFEQYLEETLEFINYDRYDDGYNKEGTIVIWFDNNDLQAGDNYEGLIKTNIQRAKRFVPIISRNTLRNERRFFRKEWSIAIDENDYRLNMDYILPVRIDDCDLTSDLIPELFRDRHFMNYNSPSFEDDVKSIVRTIRR